MRAGIALANRCRKRVGILTGGSITENLSQSFSHPVVLGHHAPIVLVTKKVYGSPRFCVDCRKLK